MERFVIAKKDFPVKFFTGEFDYRRAGEEILGEFLMGYYHAPNPEVFGIFSARPVEDTIIKKMTVVYLKAKSNGHYKPYAVTFEWSELGLECEAHVYTEPAMNDNGERFTNCPAVILTGLHPASPRSPRGQFRARCEAMRHARVEAMLEEFDRTHLRQEPHTV